MSEQNITSYTKFNEIFLQILNKPAPLENKLLRVNHASFILNPLTDYSFRNYKKRKTNVTGSRKSTEKTFNNLNTSFVLDNKLFWKIVKPFFSNEGSHRGNIILVEGDKLLQNDSEIPEELLQQIYKKREKNFFNKLNTSFFSDKKLF